MQKKLHFCNLYLMPASTLTQRRHLTDLTRTGKHSTSWTIFKTNLEKWRQKKLSSASWTLLVATFDPKNGRWAVCNGYLDYPITSLLHCYAVIQYLFNHPAVSLVTQKRVSWQSRMRQYTPKIWTLSYRRWALAGFKVLTRATPPMKSADQST